MAERDRILVNLLLAQTVNAASTIVIGLVSQRGSHVLGLAEHLILDHLLLNGSLGQVSHDFPAELVRVGQTNFFSSPASEEHQGLEDLRVLHHSELFERSYLRFPVVVIFEFVGHDANVSVFVFNVAQLVIDSLFVVGDVPSKVHSRFVGLLPLKVFDFSLNRSCCFLISNVGISLRVLILLLLQSLESLISVSF